MIKSKIDARERALELAVAQSEKRNVVHFDKNGLPLERDVLATAQAFESYLIGDAELPEVFNENTPLKEFIEMAKKGMEDINKRNDDLFGDIIKSLPEDVIRDKGLVGIIPCKSDVE